MEKSGTITLTQSEVDEIKSGHMPERVLEWGLSLSELCSIITSESFVLA